MAGQGEFGVISDELLVEQVRLQAPKHAQVYESESGWTDADVRSLRLDFHSILHIDNLLSFTTLTKLQLDNNLIERIENLGTLVNLTWLDLSYNNIDKIEGLEALVNLTDLSLQHNQIKRIEGLDSLTNLDVLSLGDNALESLEEAPVLYLRQFENLRSVSLAGNPLASDPAYSLYMVGFVPQLLYLDWRRVTDQMRTSAATTYTNQIETLKIKEEERAKKAAITTSQEAKSARYEAAAVPGMYEDAFFAELCNHSDDIKLLHAIPAVREATESFKVEVLKITQEIGEQGLSLADKRREEREEIADGVRLMSEAVASESAAKVASLLESKNKAILAVQGAGGASAAARLEGVSDQIDEVRKELLDVETDLSKRISEAISMFARTTQELLEQSMAINSEHMTALRETEEQYFLGLQNAASGFFDAYSRGLNEDGVDVSDELHMLMRDKESVLNVVINAHDAQVIIMDNKEDALTKLPAKELEAYVKALTEAEHSRHRERISEVRAFVDFQNDDIENVDYN